MSPELLAGLALIFTAFGVRGLSAWIPRSERPMIFWKLGRTGSFLHRTIFVTIILGGVSLIVWSLIYATWWSTPAAFVLAWILVQVSRLSNNAEAFITSALGPALCAIVIIALHFVTWF